MRKRQKTCVKDPNLYVDAPLNVMDPKIKDETKARMTRVGLNEYANSG